MARQLIDYLPDVLRIVREYGVITSAEQPEIELLWAGTDNVFDDQFVLDATVNGIRRWESMLHITPKATDTLDDRRYRIITQLLEQLPFTYRLLEQLLDLLCGEGNYTLTLDHNSYDLTVLLGLAIKSQYDAVAEMLSRIVPANLVINVHVKYNRHENLRPYTHEELSAYTHEYLREGEKFSDDG